MNNTEEKKVSKNRQKKESLVAEMGEKVGKAKGLVFTNYQGLTHQQIEGLKRSVKAVDAEYVITKNRLVLRSLEGTALDDETKSQLQQPTATLFMYSDVVEPLKGLAKSLKEIELPTIKFGIIEGKVLTGQEILKLSTLPPMQTLRAQLLGQMNAPIQGLHRALSWNLQSLVMTLSAISKQKSATSS
jgi:large subunit ribosomal protein L10